MIVSFDVIFTGDLPKAVLGGQPEAGACEAPRWGLSVINSPPVSSAMPPCFDKWCKRFDDLLKALEEFITAMSYRFFQWLNQNLDVFIAYKASLGLVWA